MTDFRTYANRYQGKQCDIAAALDISQPYLSLLLAGKKKPSLALAVRIEIWSGGAVPVSSWVIGATALCAAHTVSESVATVTDKMRENLS